MSFNAMTNLFSPLRHVHARSSGRMAYFGGGTSSAPTEQTITQTNIPEEFKPYFERMLGRAEAQTLQPYQPYGAPRVAQSSQFGDIGASQTMTRNLAQSGTPYVSEAAGMTRGAAQGAMGLASMAPYQFSQYGGFQAGQATPYAGFQAGQASPYAGFQATQGQEFGGFQAGQAQPFADFQQTQGQEFGGFQATQVSPYAGFQATQGREFGAFQAGQAQPFSDFQETRADPFADFAEAGYQEFQYSPTVDFGGSEVSRYMDPYMQQVVDVQKRRATEDYDIARQGRNARAVEAGAFGGSRQAVQESLAERDLLERQGELQARGLSTAYTDAQRMFEADRAARMGQQQAQAAEAARVQGGLAGEAARVQQARAAELARVQGVSQEEAARVQQARAAELARTQGIGIEEAARIQQAQAAEAARVQGMSQEEAARVQQAQAAELARTQGISVDEASRIQQARAAEAARVQGMSQEEAARVQQARAAELARTQGIGIDEASRIQSARAAEAARVQGMTRDEFARVQQAQAAELARTQGIGLDEAARVQQAQAAELARTQGISLDEAARIQAAQASELARVQGAQAGENRSAQQFGLDALGFYSGQAGQLANLGEQERAAQIQNAQMLEAIGQAQRGEAQAGLDIGYQDYLRQQGYPQEQLGFYSDILRGLPVANVGTSSTQGYQSYNPLQQALGAGLSGLSLYKAYQG